MNLVILGTTPFTPPQLAALRSLLPDHDMSVDDALAHIGSVRIAGVTATQTLQAQLETLGAQHRWDYALLPEGRRLTDFRLVAMDMDSTLITIECVDEIADYCGLKAEVSAITEAAMRGEIKDFNESLTRRVALLKGLDAGALERVYEDRLRFSPGAESMLLGVQARGLKTLLVSGGFTYFTERLKPRLKLDATRANTLEIVDGKLTGRVLGEIVNAEVKARAVREMCEQIGAAPHQAIVIGDGSNDLQMMAAAGLSIAFRAKPVVRAQASVAFNHVGLDALLRLFDA
ncbi:phosphoserine phosphatase [Pandoraea thiooxydans]|uniref:Phosphoserine phosphatase n=1 Tax=Pandoraea thiooxydans TaxID=445709 RepID=A0A0G3ENC7_9BURK|nr:phosphoserine phosphatase SerB [Pandoraea thiooxydans]AKJ67489.1 phosphoserine phosphatase SerB [Pandoraea thiooxydans]APR94541.1 phosphoserine phosphatase [Pandoraea thiooxydans]